MKEENVCNRNSNECRLVQVGLSTIFTKERKSHKERKKSLSKGTNLTFFRAGLPQETIRVLGLYKSHFLFSYFQVCYLQYNIAEQHKMTTSQQE